MSIVYPWQQDLWEQFQRIRIQDRIPHALLLTAQQGMGLSHFAHAIAETMLCPKKDTPCRQCQDCLLIDAHNHPDLFLIDIEKNSTQITVIQVRELIDFTRLKSFSGHMKVAIIKRADSMNRYAANTLLKTLEDPAENTLFILLTQRPMTLPITVRSRCQPLAIKPQVDEQTLDWVRTHLTNTDCDAQQALQLAGGAPLLAIVMGEQDEIAVHSTILSGFIELIDGQQNPLKLAHHWHTIGCEKVLSWLLQVNYKMVRCKIVQSDLSIGLENADKERLQYHIKRLNLIQLVKSYQQIMQQYQLMLSPTNLNALGLLESLTIYWRSHFGEQKRVDHG